MLAFQIVLLCLQCVVLGMSITALYLLRRK